MTPHTQIDPKSGVVTAWHTPPGPHVPSQVGYPLPPLQGIGLQENVNDASTAHANPFGHSSEPR